MALRPNRRDERRESLTQCSVVRTSQRATLENGTRETHPSNRICMALRPNWRDERRESHIAIQLLVPCSGGRNRLDPSPCTDATPSAFPPAPPCAARSQSSLLRQRSPVLGPECRSPFRKMK